MRDHQFWHRVEIRNLIEEILGFLSNDKYSLKFVPLHRDRVSQSYFKFGDQQNWPFHHPDRVIMFSGGLDSLAGAVETAMEGGKLVLVSHRPVSTMDSRQRVLFSKLQERFPDQMIRVPVWVNKKESFGREPTQRTRSFLFAALGTLVAHSVQGAGLRFYENGLVSLNLPIAQEALRARASRTTHPVTLNRLSTLCGAILEHDFVIDNPYRFKTRTEVVAGLAAHQAAHLIPYTCSCAHSMFKPNTQRHCGQCSQCIDRRFAILGANLQGYEPNSDYKSDVFVGPRQTDLDRAIAMDYVRHGIELNERSADQLAALFNTEISRAVRYEPRRSEAAQRIIAMHQRHGEVVAAVLKEKVSENAARLLNRTLEPTSLLALAIGEQQLEWRSYSSATEMVHGMPTTGHATVSERLEARGSDISRIEGKLDAVLAKFETSKLANGKKKIKRSLGRRDTIIFAAVVRELRGRDYCSYLHDHGVRPRWEQPAPATYPRGYEIGDPWRKKIQDEKTRARVRMSTYAPSELPEAFIQYLPKEFDELSRLFNSRNSRGASKNPAAAKTA